MRSEFGRRYRAPGDGARPGSRARLFRRELAVDVDPGRPGPAVESIGPGNHRKTGDPMDLHLPHSYNPGASINRKRSRRMAEPRAQRRLTVIQASDIVGFSQKMGSDENHALQLLDKHNEILTQSIEKASTGQGMTAKLGVLLEGLSVGGTLAAILVPGELMLKRKS